MMKHVCVTIFALISVFAPVAALHTASCDICAEPIPQAIASAFHDYTSTPNSTTVDGSGILRLTGATEGKLAAAIAAIANVTAGELSLARSMIEQTLVDHMNTANRTSIRISSTTLKSGQPNSNRVNKPQVDVYQSNTMLDLDTLSTSIGWTQLLVDIGDVASVKTGGCRLNVTYLASSYRASSNCPYDVCKSSDLTATATSRICTNVQPKTGTTSDLQHNDMISMVSRYMAISSLSEGEPYSTTPAPTAVPTPAPTCFRCDTKVLLSTGEYQDADALRVGDDLWSFDDRSVRIKSIVKQDVPHQDLEHVITIPKDACGVDQPLADTHVTSNHAILCPRYFHEVGVANVPGRNVYVFPPNLPKNYRRAYNDTAAVRVCNIDVGDPDQSLVLQGMIAESWDGRLPHESRPYLWSPLSDNHAVVERMKVRSFSSYQDYVAFMNTLPVGVRKNVEILSVSSNK